jgi:hypothetical protein
MMGLFFTVNYQCLLKETRALQLVFIWNLQLRFETHLSVTQWQRQHLFVCVFLTIFLIYPSFEVVWQRNVGTNRLSKSTWGRNDFERIDLGAKRLGGETTCIQKVLPGLFPVSGAVILAGGLILVVIGTRNELPSDPSLSISNVSSSSMSLSEWYSSDLQNTWWTGHYFLTHCQLTI